MIKVGETREEIFKLSYKEADDVLCLGSPIKDRPESYDIPCIGEAKDAMVSKIEDFYCARSVTILSISFHKTSLYEGCVLAKVKYNILKDF